MTRKKYERDTYNDGLTTESESSEEEEEELTEDETWNIVQYYWDPFEDQNIGRWVSYTDVFVFLFSPEPCAHYSHLVLPGDNIQYLYTMVARASRDLKLETNADRVSRVLYSILHHRNKFLIIHRDNTHWTKRVNRSIYKLGVY